MATDRLVPSIRHQVAAAVFAIVVGLSAFQPRFAANSADICSMACCVEEGHCCCTPARAGVAGQTRERSNSISNLQVSSPCPEGCSTGYSLSNLFSRGSLRAGNPIFQIRKTGMGSYTRLVSGWRPFESSSFPPRAPPFI